MDKPDFVSLVCPPITTIAKIEALTVASQNPTSFSFPRVTNDSFMTLNMIGLCFKLYRGGRVLPLYVENARY